MFIYESCDFQEGNLAGVPGRYGHIHTVQQVLGTATEPPEERALHRNWLILKKCNLIRHSTSNTHKEALEDYCQRLLAGDSAVSTFSCAQAASAPQAAATGAQAASATAVSVKTRDPAADYQGLLAARILLETHGSFHSYTLWRNALVSEAHRQALNSEWRLR